MTGGLRPQPCCWCKWPGTVVSVNTRLSSGNSRKCTGQKLLSPAPATKETVVGRFVIRKQWKLHWKTGVPTRSEQSSVHGQKHQSTSTYSHTHTHTHARAHAHTRTCMQAHTCTHTHTRTHSYTHTHIHTHMHAHTHARTRMHTHTPSLAIVAKREGEE